MDAVKAEIERKRKLAQEAKSSKKQKYFRRKDLEDVQGSKSKLDEEEKALKDEEAMESPPSLSSPSKRNTSDTGSDRTDSSTISSPKASLPKKEVIAMLRRLGEPITMFGESDGRREERLRKCQSERDTDVFDEGADNYSASMRGKDKEDDKKGERSAIETEADLHRRDGSSDVHDICYVYLKRLMMGWEKDIDELPAEYKKKPDGRKEVGILKQTQSYINPLFKLLLKRSVPKDIMSHLEEMVGCMKERRYTDALDSYLRIAIGNAPWPMGVTMVGIHERAGREKLFANNMAHVLNDDRQLHYLHAVRRLLTVCQKKNPNPDPSKNIG
eukprot:CAMPEP_0113883710 /NCGR_PEP_ID=MMETSP0780_2-20120614/9774_1 /TAXON_ID=652834 /ORGANISM="Palpitomonas bilix" /LENGTH=328 /DNA_ID=CAMNT_0000871091 /DNA_START=106 /DNA_END=1092 /DNA_ORIENTATION=- /assembly_acc=CAM_ASM_000599